MVSNTGLTVFVFDRVENILVKGEIAGNKHFLLFPTMFPTI